MNQCIGYPSCEKCGAATSQGVFQNCPSTRTAQSRDRTEALTAFVDRFATCDQLLKGYSGPSILDRLHLRLMLAYRWCKKLIGLQPTCGCDERYAKWKARLRRLRAWVLRTSHPHL
jgi:hypothetical protein